MVNLRWLETVYTEEKTAEWGKGGVPGRGEGHGRSGQNQGEHK